MAKTSGGVGRTGGFAPGDHNYKGKIDGIKPLSSIKHNDVYRDIKQGIAKYHSRLGVRQKDIKIANLDAGTNGVHVTSGGVSSNIYLSSSVFNKPKGEIIARTKKAYDSGWSTKTNKPIQHTVVHELAHATWNSHLSSPSAQAAGKDITKLHKSWQKYKKKSGYGEYSKTNINEFWAEVTTKGVLGKSDKYTRSAKSIIKKYKL